MRDIFDNRYSLWLAVPYSLFVAVLVPVYWVHYGPGNFLWFSDIALFAVAIALWTGARLAYSTMAIGVLPLEVIWTVDFVSGGAATGLAAYMFDSDLPLYLRALSLFHLFLPPFIIGMLICQGYDRRALTAHTALFWIVLLATRTLTGPEDNINWVYGLGPDAIQTLPQWLYFPAYMAVIPVLVFLPMHLLLSRLCRP